MKEVKPEDKNDLMEIISGMKYYSMLEGVPGYTKEDEKFQGVDRLVDVMLGDSFGFMIIASAVDYDGLKEIEENLYSTYARLAPLSKQSLQRSESFNQGTGREALASAIALYSSVDLLFSLTATTSPAERR